MTPGKFRHLSQCSTPAGHFVVLAIDHRANLRTMLEKHQGLVTDEEFRDFKMQVIEACQDIVSGILVDPAFGLASVIARRTFRGGLIAPLEVTDYGTHPSLREPSWIPGWSIKKIKRVGADGAKLLLPYHPELENAIAKEQMVEEVARECRARDLPLFLEPIVCSHSPDTKLTSAEHRTITVQMSRHFARLGADVLKLQLPSDESDWEPTCLGITQLCQTPWALLSGGVDFETYCRQAEVASSLGASGVMAGRSVWSDATKLRGVEREAFLRDVVPARVQRLADICAAHASPFTDKAPADQPALNWYEGYGNSGR